MPAWIMQLGSALLRRRLVTKFRFVRLIFGLTFVSLTCAQLITRALGAPRAMFPVYLLLWVGLFACIGAVRARLGRSRPYVVQRNLEELLRLAEHDTVRYPPSTPPLLARLVWMCVIVAVFMVVFALCKRLGVPLMVTMEAAPVIVAIYVAVLETYDSSRPDNEYGIVFNASNLPSSREILIEALRLRLRAPHVFEDGEFLLAGPIHNRALAATILDDPQKDIGMSRGRIVPWPFP